MQYKFKRPNHFTVPWYTEGIELEITEVLHYRTIEEISPGIPEHALGRNNKPTGLHLACVSRWSRGLFTKCTVVDILFGAIYVTVEHATQLSSDARTEPF